jgi:hypothetical protein
MLPPFSLENLYPQYLRCWRHKRYTHNAIQLETRLEPNFIQLREELDGRTLPFLSFCLC